MEKLITNKLIDLVVSGELSAVDAAKRAYPGLHDFSPLAAGCNKTQTEAFFTILKEWQKSPTQEEPSPARSTLRSSGETRDGYRIAEGGYDDDDDAKSRKGPLRHR